MQADIKDVIIIGSGASGGMAAWNLTRKGINVTMLDAGRKFERREFWTHVNPWERQQRLDAGQKPPSFILDTAEQPYITPLGQNFSLTRVWGRGGKTNIWGRVSLRYGDLDFAGPERDGPRIAVLRGIHFPGSRGRLRPRLSGPPRRRMSRTRCDAEQARNEEDQPTRSYAL